MEILLRKLSKDIRPVGPGIVTYFRERIYERARIRGGAGLSLWRTCFPLRFSVLRFSSARETSPQSAQRKQEK
jgi:hypothetical protein